MQKIPLAIITFFTALPLLAETTLSGKVDDMTIDSSGNPYIITDNMVVPPGKSLTIGQGSVLLFKPFTGLIIEGSIVVEGTLEKPVVFSSTNDTKFNPSSTQPANPFDWNGIFVSQKAGRVNLSNFILTYSVYGIKSQKEEFLITNGTFARNGQFHVTVNDAIKKVYDDIPFSFGDEVMKKPVPNVNSTGVAAWKKPAALGLGAAGVAFIGTGGYLFYLSGNYASKYSSASTKKDADNYYNKRNSTRIAAVVCGICGVASVAGGVVLYPWKSKTGKTASVSFTPLLGIRNGISIGLNY